MLGRLVIKTRVPAGTALFRESGFGVSDKRRFCACWGDLQPECLKTNSILRGLRGLRGEIGSPGPWLLKYPPTCAFYLHPPFTSVTLFTWGDPLLSFAARLSRSACCTWRTYGASYPRMSQGRWRLLRFASISWPRLPLTPPQCTPAYPETCPSRSKLVAAQY